MLYLAWFGALVMQLILFMGVVWWQVRFWAWLELRSWWWGRWNCLRCLGRLASFLDWQRSWRCWGRENSVILLVLVFLICLWLLPGGYLTVLSGFSFLLFALFWAAWLNSQLLGLGSVPEVVHWTPFESRPQFPAVSPSAGGSWSPVLLLRLLLLLDLLDDLWFNAKISAWFIKRVPSKPDHLSFSVHGLLDYCLITLGLISWYFGVTCDNF